ncbi:MAG: hypothetical protein ACE5I5_00875 [Candidatus Heimdallarchaeota archaeon]
MVLHGAAFLCCHMGDGILIEGSPGLQPGCHPCHRRLILLFRTADLKIGKVAIHLPAFARSLLAIGQIKELTQTKYVWLVTSF